MSAKIPYRSPETPATPAPRLRWTLRVPEGHGGQAALISATVTLAVGWFAEAFGCAVFGATGAVLRGLLVCVLGTLVFCALFVRRAPEVMP